MNQHYDVVIIGGGFFGSRMAVHLRRFFERVLVVEASDDLMLHASYHNQARVHGGYHYPRSILTGLRSRVNLPDFYKEYPEVVDESFGKYYAIGKNLSKVSAQQFYLFCQRIGAPIEAAGKEVTSLFDKNLVEAVFKVDEYAFNADLLRERVKHQIKEVGVDYVCNTQVERVTPHQSRLRVICTPKNGIGHNITAEHVFNATYAGLNHVNERSELPKLPLKHELAELALVEVPEEIRKLGVTVMCGPFFSLMPFPAQQLHSFSHVRYTPHFEWSEEDKGWSGTQPASAFPKMLADAQRFMPLLKKVKYRHSLWEVKTVLRSSEKDDSRPILFRPNHGMPNYHCVMGGKIDNIYDVLKELDILYAPALQTS